MIAIKKCDSARQVIEFIQGVEVSSGSVGTNGAGSPNFSDATVDVFENVQEGDHIHISGEAGPLDVDTKTDDNHLILSGNIVAAHAAVAKYRVFRGGISTAVLLFGSPIWDGSAADSFTIFYETTTFGV